MALPLLAPEAQFGHVQGTRLTRFCLRCDEERSTGGGEGGGGGEGERVVAARLHG